jgi:hypothetical protein
MESKYLMAIIKMPIEIFKNGKTITHEDKCVIDYEPINELPTTLNNNKKLDLSKLFHTEDNDFKFKTFVEYDDPDEKNDDQDDDPDEKDDDQDDDPDEKNDDPDEKDDDPDEEDEEEDTVNQISPLLEKKIYIKSEEMLKKKSRSKNSTFKNKKFNTKQPTRKMYPPMVDNDPDVDLVQSLEDPGSLLEDD